MTERIGRDTFTALVGGHVEIRVPEQEPIPLSVDEVDDTDGGEGLRFSVLFSGPAARPLPQGIHSVVPPGCEPFDLFMVPFAREGDLLRYEAVFNRLG